MPIPEAFATRYRIATSLEIRSWSYGQVTKNRETLSGSLDEQVGTLDDQRIFGSVVDDRCACGKYDGFKFSGMVCDRCGVKVASVSERRARFGHIDLSLQSVGHPFEPSHIMDCFPVIPGDYLLSESRGKLCRLYEQLLINNTSVRQLTDYLLPLAIDSLQSNAKDHGIFTRGIGLVERNAK